MLTDPSYTFQTVSDRALDKGITSRILRTVANKVCCISVSPQFKQLAVFFVSNKKTRKMTQGFAKSIYVIVTAVHSFCMLNSYNSLTNV
jgi:hypothetical protein